MKWGISIKQYAYLLGILSIVVSAFTWSLDLGGVIQPCIYCRIERMIIGILGIVILLPIIPYLSSYAGYVFGFFGASVASNQIFSLLYKQTYDMELLLAIGALFFIIAQVIFLAYQKNNKP